MKKNTNSLPNLELLSNEQLIESYSKIILLLKKRKVIRSRNLIADLGEYLATSHYCNTIGLPNLQFAPKGTKNIDAISRNGERYSIKSTSTTKTGSFWGLNPPGSEEEEIQKFEYVIVVIFNENYKLIKIVELNWNQFLKLKRWDSRMNVWYLGINSKFEKTGKIIYDNKNNEKT